MFDQLQRRRRDREGAEAIYAAIVAQARQPAFYERLGVPDTIDGRFEMIVLHLVLLFHRLGPEGDAGKKLAQDVFDAFAADMDRSLRELGVSDLGVPKRVKAMGKSFYGRLNVYGRAIADNDAPGLAISLARNIGPARTAPEMAGLASYALAVADALRRQPEAAIRTAAIGFPDPAGALVAVPA